MTGLRNVGLTLVAAVACSFVAAPLAAESPPHDEVWQQVLQYEYGQDLRPLLAVERLVDRAMNDAALRQQLAARLSAALEDPQTTAAARQFLCYQLQLVGDDAAVPALDRLLDDPAAADEARMALEKIPGEAALAALRSGLERTEGPVLLGVIHTLGERRDERSVESLTELAQGRQEDVAEAALWALGKIGGPQAAAVLREALAEAEPGRERRIAAAYLGLADQALDAGKVAEAVAMYKTLYGESSLRPVRRAALTGLLKTSGSEQPQRILALLAGEDGDARAVAAGQVWLLDDAAFRDALLAALPELPKPGRALLLEALAHQGETGVLPVARSAARDEARELRLAGIRSLAALGDAGAVPLLAESLEGEAEFRAAAVEALVLLTAEGADSAIVAAMQQAEPARQAMLIDILKTRRAAEAVAALLAAAADPDEAIHESALRALRELAEPEEVPAMIDLLLATETGRHRDEIERAILLVCQQIPDAQQRAAPVLAALEGASPAERAALLPVAGRIGGPGALEAIEEAMASGDAALVEAGIRGLCNWPDASVAEWLLDLAREADMAAHRIWALRAYIRVVTLPSDRAEEETLAMLREGMELATRDEEQRLALSRAGAVRSIETLRWVMPFLDVPALAEEARLAVVELAHHRFLTHENPEEFKAALDRVIADSDDRHLLDRAERYRQTIP